MGGLRRLVPHAALALLLGALALVSWRTLAALQHVPDAAELKRRDADRVIAYRVLRDRGPSFRLDGGPVRLKLVSEAVIDGGFDAERVTSYGLRLTVRDGDRVLRASDVYVQSRESKAGWDGSTWRDEASWAVDPIELTDERVVVVDLPDMPTDAVVTVTLVGAPREALLRMFREQPRDAAQRRAAAQRLLPAARADLVRSSTYVPWPLMPPAEQEARLVHRWLRMAAEGRDGVDFTTRTIFVTDFRTAVAAAGVAEGIEVIAGHDAAIDVRGPARVVVRELVAGVPSPPSRLRVAEVSAAGVHESSLTSDGAIDVSAAPVTLVVRTDAPEPVRFTLSGPPDAQIAAVDVRAPAPGQLVPDRVRIPLVVTGPGTVVAARVRKVPGAPLLGRGVRVDARVIASQRDAPETASLWITYRGADGRRLGGDRVIVGGAVSRFERLARGGPRTPGDARAVTEPTSFRVIAPAGAARVELAADRDVALRLYRWVPGPGGDRGDRGDRIEEPYRAVAVDGFRWRYARLVERSWFPMLPANHEALAATGRTATLDAQVRLEPEAPGEPAHARLGDYQALAPIGAPEQQRALEPVPDDELALVLAAWPRGARTAIAPGAERVIESPASSAARPRLSWVVDPDAVGGALDVAIDDAHTKIAITSARGAADLPRLSPGRHRVRVVGAARALWIDRPPVDGARVLRDRTLYPLGLDGLRVRVRQRAGEDVHVYAIVYAMGAAASARTTLVMTVDGRRPPRRSGVVAHVTPPEVRVTLPAARRDAPATLVDLGGRSAGLPRSIGIALLADLEPGLHEIDLNRIGGDALWVRFVTTQRRAAAPAPATQWSISGGPRLEVIDE